MSWDAFAAGIAAAGSVPRETATQEARLLEDLGLDSLALAEVITFMLVDLGMETLSADLDEREWTNVRLDELFTEYRDGKRPMRVEHTIRVRPRP